MAGDHLSARQRNGEWWAQHNLSTTSGLHPDTTGPGTGANAPAIRLPRYGQCGMPLVDKHARLYTNGGTPDKNKGLMLEAVYATTVTGFNFFGGPWGRTIVRHYGWYGFALNIEMVPLNDSINDTQGRPSVSVADVGGAWPHTTLFLQRWRINDGQPHHLAALWPPGSKQVALYCDGVLVEVKEYQSTMADLAPDEVWVSANAFFTHCDGWVTHAYSGPAPASGHEVIARAGLTPSLDRQNVAAQYPGHRGPLPDAGRVMAWDDTNKQWLPVKGWSGSAWKEVKAL